MRTTPPVDLASPTFKSNPHAFYSRLRAESPVYRTTVQIPTRKPAWLITRYDDVVVVLKDSRFVKDPKNAGSGSAAVWLPGALRAMTRNMLDLDPPDHTRLRALVQKAFTPKLVEQLRARISELCDGLLAPAAARGHIELVREYALPLPMAIITELLGIPNADRQRFHTWSSRMVSVSRPRDALLALPAAWMFLRYLRRLFAFRRRRPGDDLLSALLQVEEAGDRLSTDELLAMAVLLLIAGHETTVNLIAGGALTLLEHPEQLEQLRVKPGLMGTAVEELLRYVTPVEIASERYAAQDVELCGQSIRRGELVLPVLGSANRDANRFESPDEVDIARSPNHHLAFGQGAHYCLGAPLARLETHIALDTLFHQLPGVRLASLASLRWRRSLFLRGLERLPLITRPAMRERERPAA
jgi:cytochrome P450